MPFSEKWEKKDQGGGGIINRLRVGTGQTTPLKVQIEAANRQIKLLISQLDNSVQRIKQRDETIFRHVVSSLAKHDNEHAMVYANELSEIRKMGKMVTQAQLAMEQISLRLGTITDLGEIASTLAPAVTVIRSMKDSLSFALPEADREIGEISGLLSSILVDAGTTGGISMNFEAANEEAVRVLEEASEVAEERMREDFPAIPAGVQTERESEDLSA
ncbi:MAG TPA: Snf7 family protein [Nitrososphaerales archaeon]|nr:Snf7 family protein [Nitrososphaerales archaeon]